MEKKRRCDVCELQMAVFYCDADEAYLCQVCDAAVHGANTLASRHKRIKVLAVGDEEEKQEIYDEEDEDRTCPADFFQESSRSFGRSSMEFPTNALRIGDITFARVSKDGKEQDESHRVPHFVPVAQELPSLEPFRFHALAASAATENEDVDGSPPRFNGKFMSLLEADHNDPEDVASSAENLELGVVPEISQPQKPAAGTEAAAPIKGIKADKDREARVNRYRQKRQTRMFSKKIRYEVRKIYAENRPRLKGRFVRRSEVDELVA